MKFNKKFIDIAVKTSHELPFFIYPVVRLISLINKFIIFIKIFINVLEFFQEL